MWSRGILRKLGTRLNRSAEAEFFSLASSTRGIGRADQLRTIRIAFGILSNGVPKLASSSIQSLSSEKKEKKKKKRLESFPFSLSLSTIRLFLL